MANTQQCSFFLLRYVPDAVKNEFVNIGLVLLPPGGAPELRFTHDWSRVRCLDAEADVEVLGALESDLRDQLHGLNGDRESILRRIQDSFSNALQPSEIKACLAESPALEADELARLYLEHRRPRAQREPSARHVIRERMQQAFESVGVWPLMWHNVEVAKYTRKGDPLKIDCGYSPNGTVKLFHALAIETDPNSAKVLAFSCPPLAEGILKLESKRTELAAVVGDDLPTDDEQTSFVLDILRKQKIRIVPISAVPGEAQNAAAEMRI
ncbi:MAG TPA: DUF3037 domain-containing protein [Candidatus Angelobacter sp.]|nr:DUF3037 domain-containing protein [Candidatus Angelobacter sp.]